MKTLVDLHHIRSVDSHVPTSGIMEYINSHVPSSGIVECVDFLGPLSGHVDSDVLSSSVVE